MHTYIYFYHTSRNVIYYHYQCNNRVFADCKTARELFILIVHRFANLGNTCYMNAVLQVLLGMEPFAEDLLNQKLIKQVDSQSLCRYTIPDSFYHIRRAKHAKTLNFPSNKIIFSAQILCAKVNMEGGAYDELVLTSPSSLLTV